MPDPQSPYVVSGQVFTSRGTVPNSVVRISGDIVTITDSRGRYVLDLANLQSGYTSGSNYTIISFDEFDEEYLSDTITVTGENQTKNLFLEARSVTTDQTRNSETRHVELRGVSNKPFTRSNLLPVETWGREVTRLVSGNNYPKYIGEAAPGTLSSAAKWRISYVLSNGQVTWADGNARFDKVWTDREGYIYS